MAVLHLSKEEAWAKNAVVVQSLSRVWLFATPWTAARQASQSITNSRSLLKLMSLESVMPSNHLILCCPFSFCPQSFWSQWKGEGSFQKYLRSDWLGVWEGCRGQDKTESRMTDSQTFLLWVSGFRIKIQKKKLFEKYKFLSEFQCIHYLVINN